MSLLHRIQLPRMNGMIVSISNRDRFLKKKCGNQTVGAAGLANGGRGAEGVRSGEGVSPPHWGRKLCPLYRKKIRSQIGEFWCKLGAFCTVHLKLVLRSWERRSHSQNNFGNSVPRRSRWKRSLISNRLQEDQQLHRSGDDR